MPSVETYTQLGQCCEQLGEFSEAVKYYGVILKQTPKMPNFGIPMALCWKSSAMKKVLMTLTIAV